MTTLYCAECTDRFEPDDNHTRLEAEHVRMDDRNGRDDYVLCPDCWADVTEGWIDPA